jgi:hypothetical protein
MKGFKYLALLAALVGCDEGIISQKSNDISIDPRSALCSDTNATPSLVFPRVTPPRTEVKVVTIGQGGETDLTVDEIYIEGFEDCDRVKLGFTESDRLPDEVIARCPLMIDVRPDLPVTMGQDENRTVNIRFQPTTLQVPPETRLFIKSNVRDKEETCVGIGFQQARPEIVAEPVVAFSGGVAGTEFLQVRNIGSGPLVVQQRTLNLISAPAINPQTQEPVPEFTVTEQRALPWEIPANGAETLEIRYEPFDGDRDTAELVFTSNDPQTPELRVLLTSAPTFGVLGVDPNPAVFGSPAAGEGLELPISFSNAGVRYVDVQSIELVQPGTDYSISGSQQTSFRLQGGAARELRVLYRPLDATGSDGELRITYDDGDDRTDPVLSVPLVRSGAALPAIINLDPAVVDQSDLALGASETTDVTITNAGGQDLTITRIALSDDTDAGLPPSDPEYTIEAGGMGVTLGAGESHTVKVKLTRGDERIVLIAALVIESNAASSPDVVFFTSNPPRE